MSEYAQEAPTPQEGQAERYKKYAKIARSGGWPETDNDGNFKLHAAMKRDGFFNLEKNRKLHEDEEIKAQIRRGAHLPQKVKAKRMVRASSKAN